jgi:folate-dependent phosphoribosylglycinamide formyltransferase PurN
MRRWRWLEERRVTLVVCAGYMHLLRKPFFDRYGGRIVNTHSAPLPDFPGRINRGRACRRRPESAARSTTSTGGSTRAR